LFNIVPDLLTTFYNVHVIPCYHWIYGLDIILKTCIIAMWKGGEQRDTAKNKPQRRGQKSKSIGSG
jgi:hypothetical protein